MTNVSNIIRRLAGPWVTRFSGMRVTHDRPLLHVPQSRPKVLVVGVYMAEKENLAGHLVSRFASSRHCDVVQRWVAIGPKLASEAVAAVTVEEVFTRTPKFTLINRLIEPDDLERFNYIMVCDDDISVPYDFVDRFIGWQQFCGFALAQPARTWNSYVDHGFVRQSLFSRARETRFVEIGPVFCFNREMARLALPFDPTSPMGWGYDLVWPIVARQHGLTLGIIDDAAVEHRIRAQGTLYAMGPEYQRMAQFLGSREHIASRDAFVVRQRYR